MIINSLIAYSVYLLGAALFILDVIAKYKRIAEANPNPSIAFNAKIFWRKESVNIIKILLWGIATPILIIPLTGMSVAFHNSAGALMFTTSVKVILMPIYFIIGYSGGRATMAIAGQYKKELYDKVGIKDDTSKDDDKEL
jgi:hypothetical protein